MKIDFKELVKIKHKKTSLDKIIFYPEVLKFCSIPYKNNNEGCPNQEICKEAPYFEELEDYNHYYLIYAKFDFKKYKFLRKTQNPTFFNSEGRLTCCLYWQNSVKRVIKDYFINLWNKGNRFYLLGSGSVYSLPFQEKIFSMEAAGINVFSTLKLNQIGFELKIKNTITLCNLLCSNELINFKKSIQNSIIHYT
jgi:hypothetical protein